MIAQDVVSRVKKLLLDVGASPRYSDLALLEFFNDAPAAILGLKPSALVNHQTIDLVAGAKQALPENSLFLHDMPYNEVTHLAIRRVERTQLDQFKPGWQGGEQTEQVNHFMYDDMDPKVFWVYPPNDGKGSVNAELTYLPEAIDSLDAELPFSDEYREPYVYYIAYRAMDWESDEPNNAQRAQLFYQKFAGTLGVQIRNAGNTSPQRKEP